MNTELAQLDTEIANLKKQIANRQSMYRDVPQPKTQVGWSSYIVNNDRGMLDKYQDAERQWYTLKEQERHADELANKQRMQQDMMNMDENMKNRSIAEINYQYAQQALKLDHSGDPSTKAILEQKLAEAKATRDYWNKRTGNVINEVKEEDKDKEESETPSNEESDDTTSTAADMADMDAYISGTKKFATDAEMLEFIKKAKAHPDYNIKGDYRDKVNKLEAVKSEESIKREEDERKKAYKVKVDGWRKEYNALSPLKQRKWKKNNPDKAKEIGV